jgi:hypothetical protein
MLRHGLNHCAVLVAAISALAGSVRAATYNEFVSGDLSLNTSAPTTLNLELGSNLLTAQSSVTDGDLLRVVVPPNATLNSIVVEFHEGDIKVFAGLQAGSTWTAGTGSQLNLEQLLGYVDFPVGHSHGTHSGEDILDDIALAWAPPRFTTPLPSGSYAVLLQSPSTAVNYALSFNVEAATGLPGDFDNSGSVNAADLAAWRNAMLGIGVADADADGDTDGADFLVWQRNQGQSSIAATATVPEPAAAVMALPGLFLLVRRWRGAARPK